MDNTGIVSGDSTMATCLICRSEAVEPLLLCVEVHEKYCTSCWIEYINSVVHGAFMGTCPCVVCPSELHQKNKRKRIVPFETWSTVAPIETVKKFSSLANSLLAFLCGGCHSLKSLDVGYDNTGASAAKLSSMVDGIAHGSLTTEIDSIIQGMSSGQNSVDHAYKCIFVNVLPQLNSMNDVDAFELFSLILKKIVDPERRANLHLRYLRDRPRIRTLCCNREHCFQCKVKDYHEGKSCMEYTQTLDHSIINCPSCGISLAKGDGCNTITCVCGKQFSWSAEKENTDRCQQFLATHPTETNTECAKVLCESREGGDILRAKAWQSRNRLAVSYELRSWFQTQYPLCTSQCALVISTETRPDGVREAIDLWIQDHSKEVELRRKQNAIAMQSLFTSLVPNESDRPRSAYRILLESRNRNDFQNVDLKLLESATRWIENNKDFYLKGLDAIEERSAQQFLYQFGNHNINSIRPASNNCPCSVEWLTHISNHDLTYSNQGTTVERVGSVSCYPAAFSTLVAERCMFRVVVDSAPRTSNWLTFGLARRGMAASSSDGVGRTPHSWGIADDRSSSAAKSIIAVCGTEVDSFRKLNPGDILSAVVDVLEGWMELVINDSEYHYRFSIPSGNIEDYVFAMTFANDHRVSILSDPVNNLTNDDSMQLNSKNSLLSATPLNIVLSIEQSTSLNHLRRRIKSILQDDDENSVGNCSHEKSQGDLFRDSTTWLANCGGSSTQAQIQFQELRPMIEQLIGCRKRGKSSDNYAAEPHICWNKIVQAMGWYRANKFILRRDMKAQQACTFQLSHGEDAPFLAAIAFQEYTNRRLGREEIEAPLAFMEFYPDEMNEWYDQDSRCAEPMIENIAKGCRCLPRHHRNCPLIKKSA